MNIELEKERIIEQLLLVQDECLLKTMRKVLDIDSEEVSDEHQFYRQMNNLSVFRCSNMIRNLAISILLSLCFISCKNQKEGKAVYNSLKEALDETDIGKVQRLDLMGTNLDSVPIDIRQFKNLVYLDLSRNKIKTKI